MKYCPECGSKCESVGGQPAKFCSNCGHSFESKAKASSEVLEPEVVESFKGIAPDDFAILQDEAPESSSFSFGSAVKSERSGAGGSRQKAGDIKSILGRVKSEKAIDA